MPGISPNKMITSWTDTKNSVRLHSSTTLRTAARSAAAKPCPARAGSPETIRSTRSESTSRNGAAKTPPSTVNRK